MAPPRGRDWRARVHPSKMALAEELARLCERRGWIHHDTGAPIWRRLSLAAGMSGAGIWSLLRTDSTPKLETLNAIAHAAGTDPALLYKAAGLIPDDVSLDELQRLSDIQARAVAIIAGWDDRRVKAVLPLLEEWDRELEQQRQAVDESQESGE